MLVLWQQQLLLSLDALDFSEIPSVKDIGIELAIRSVETELHQQR